jgi:hypothetical protein
LVAVGVFVAAMGTGARNVTIGKELVRLFVIVLHGGFLHEFAGLIEFLEILGCRFVVLRAGGTAIDIKRNTQLFEGLFDNVVVSVNDVLWGDTLAAGLDGDGNTVFVATANEHHILTLAAEVTYIDIGGHINTGEMADMHGAVGIRKGRSDSIAFKTLVFFSVYHSILVFIG